MEICFYIIDCTRVDHQNLIDHQSWILERTSDDAMLVTGHTSPPLGVMAEIPVGIQGQGHQHAQQGITWLCDQLQLLGKELGSR